MDITRVNSILRLVLRASLFIVLFSLSAGADAPAPTIVVVVNRDNPITGLSMEQLKRIYLGKQTSFEDEIPIRLGSLAAVSERFCRSVLDMPPHGVRRYWIRMVFAGSRARPPETFESAEKLKFFVAANRGGIAFLPLSDLDEHVRAIPIEGKNFDDADYPLKAEKSR